MDFIKKNIRPYFPAIIASLYIFLGIYAFFMTAAFHTYFDKFYLLTETINRYLPAVASGIIGKGTITMVIDIIFFLIFDFIVVFLVGLGMRNIRFEPGRILGEFLLFYTIKIGIAMIYLKIKNPILFKMMFW